MKDKRSFLLAMFIASSMTACDEPRAEFEEFEELDAYEDLETLDEQEVLDELGLDPADATIIEFEDGHSAMAWELPEDAGETPAEYAPEELRQETRTVQHANCTPGTYAFAECTGWFKGAYGCKSRTTDQVIWSRTQYCIQVCMDHGVFLSCTPWGPTAFHP